MITHRSRSREMDPASSDRALIVLTLIHIYGILVLACYVSFSLIWSNFPLTS